MTTDLARPFTEDLDQLPEEIPGASNLEPGRISWLHGANVGGAKTPGVFYARDTAFNDPPGEPWKVDERYEGEAGYSAAELKIAILGERSQWFLPGEAQSDPPTWLQNYSEGAKKLTEYLILVEGIADPMVLGVSGKYKAGPFAKIISDYRRGVLAQAMRKVKRTLPLWSFWLPIAGKRDAGGKPIYEQAQDGDGKAYGSIVTPPALAGQPIPRSASEIMEGAGVWQQYQEWLRFKRLPRDTTEGSYTISTPPALPAPRNVPQPVEQEPDALEWDKPPEMSSAEYRFFVRYGHIVGDKDWSAVQRYLQSQAPKPTTPEGWAVAAEAVRDRGQNASRSVTAEEVELPPF